jgi:hypothetical protein
MHVAVRLLNTRSGIRVKSRGLTMPDVLVQDHTGRFNPPIGDDSPGSAEWSQGMDLVEQLI